MASANANSSPDAAAVWALLERLTDPEIPVVTLAEMGILRDVRAHDGRWQIVITPTYSGCPAMSQIEDDIRTALAEHGLEGEVITQLAPAWTTAWMSAQARVKLRDYGIAPPQDDMDLTGHPAGTQVLRFLPRATQTEAVPCPQCQSANTTLTSNFGSTACKALYKCLDCLEPFDYFKPH